MSAASTDTIDLVAHVCPAVAVRVAHVIDADTGNGTDITTLRSESSRLG